MFGEGPQDAQVMLVGEQPGDKEDLAGKPFVGPAGQMLDRALGSGVAEPGDVATIPIANGQHRRATGSHFCRIALA